METKIKYVVFDLKGQAEVFMAKFHEFGYTDFVYKMVKVSPYEVGLEIAIDDETEADELIEDCLMQTQLIDFAKVVEI